jgi:dihydrofolate reductase
MRKLSSFLFISLDGVVESPNKYVRSDVFEDFPELIINSTPKFVVSSTLREVNWKSSTLISHDVVGAIAKLKAQSGKTIGVHGSISLVQSLLLAGALDELRFIQVPVIAGSGRRLLEHGGPPIQLDLQSSRTTRTGLNYLVYRPRR